MRPGYANFALEEPPLKLVLIENAGATNSLNHLGVEVSTTDDVLSARKRLVGLGLETSDEDAVECCYALQDKVWVGAADGEPWEIYTVISDAKGGVGPQGETSGSARGDTACCSSVDAIGSNSSSCC